MGATMKTAEVLTCTLLIAAASTSAATITLQQGLDGYNGCMDTHLESISNEDYPDFGWKIDYSADTVLGVARENYRSLRGGTW